MMKKRHILHWAMGVVMTPLLGSCAFDELHEIAGGGNGVLSFEVGVEQLHDSQGWTRASGPQMRPMHSLELVSAQGDTIYARSQSLGIINEHSNVSPVTRAAAKTSSSDFYDNFGVIAFNYASTSTWENVKSTAKPSVYNAKATQSGGKWVVGSGNYWPGASKKVSFFAYAPYSDANDTKGIELSANTDTGAPKITYTVPSAAADQSDLLVAKALDQGGSGTSSPTLAFSHALCGVKFAVGTMSGVTKITKIAITGVYNKGTLEIGGSAWTVDNSSIGSYTIEKEISVSGISDTDITSGDDLLFLMPQTVPSGATLTITADGKEYSTSIDTESWAMGAMVTYKLSIKKITGKYEFNVTSTNVVQGATTADITVTSYFEYNDKSQKKPVKWSVAELVGENVTQGSLGGTDNDISRTVTLNFSANTATSGQDATLQSKSEVGSESSPVDLSIRKKNGVQVRETANCYVVNAPGWYMFPLVYGNGIKSNSTAYDNHLEGFNGSEFTTHESTKNMSGFTSPWIYDNYSSVTMSADLVWQDAENLIEYNTYQVVEIGGKKFIKFHISKSNIKQGNAVLAVKNSSNLIMWSWHIWVTALDVYSTQTVTSTYQSTTKTFNFMPVPLGWYSASETVNPKTYTLSVKQEGSEKTANGTVTQAGQTGSASGTCTFYQWGRKDPFPPSDGSSLTSNNNKTVYKYGTSGNSTTSNCWSRVSSQANIATSILNPSTFYYNNANWCSQQSNELWNVGENDYGVDFEPITKSVYDPSPAGFRLPETAAFTGFTVNGSSQSGTNVNGQWDSTNLGFKFTTGGVTTYWQACGYRAYNSGSLGGVGSNGNYWTAGPSYTTYGRSLYFYSSGYVYPQYGSFRAYGFSVRPVSE